MWVPVFLISSRKNRNWRLAAEELLLLAVCCLLLLNCGGSGQPVASSSSAISLAISPSASAVAPNQSQQLLATVSGTSNTGIVWAVNGLQGGSSASGTVSSTGLYLAPATVPVGGSVTVAAISVADTSKSANAVITIQYTIAVSPASAMVVTGSTQQFSASVNGVASTAVQWLVNGVTGGNATVGTISSGGFYTAPVAVSASAVTITAVSATNSLASGSAAVQLTNGFEYTASPLVSVLPNQSAGAVAATYFGMHIHRLADPSLAASQLTPFPAFSFSTQRLWDTTTWPMIEPSKGNFTWAKLDDTVAAASAHGVSDYIFTFGYVPQWASSNPGGDCAPTPLGSCFVPADMADFDNFATQLVQRYCGTITYYETWNEPNGHGYWQGTNAQLLTITQHLYSIAKNPANCGCTGHSCSPGGGTNPNKVLLPSISNVATGTTWLQNWLAFVGSPYPYADIAAFHGYGYANNPEAIYPGVQSMQSTLSQYGLGNVELWNTEASWGDGSYTQDYEASWLMRYYIVQAASGVSRFMWYAYDNCGWGTLWGPSCSATPDTWTGPREASGAYATVQQWLTGATVESCESYADGTWMCKLTRPGDYVALAVWNSDGNSTTVPVDDSLGLTQYRDWQNNKAALGGTLVVGQMPVLLENKDGV